MNKTALRDALQRAHEYTKAMVVDLDDAQWQVPWSATINPVGWELGHVAWFIERWCLRGDSDSERNAQIDATYDSSMVAHADRWSVPLPSRPETIRYLDQVMASAIDSLAASDDSDDALYFFKLALAHTDMHAESFAHTRQTLGYAAPPLKAPAAAVTGEVALEAREFLQGSVRGAPGFVFDNEKWAHPVAVPPFAIDRDVVRNRDYLAFVEDNGYRRAELWDDDGRRWLAERGVQHPVYWRSIDGQWQQRIFDRWVALRLDDALMHVSAHEAAAYCRWRGRRLPSEAEWELAAAAGAISWGNDVWEWTASAFTPYPGFDADAYRDYSQPWFGTHRSVRGGSAATPSRLVHPKFRNFYEPHRADIFVGFRTGRTLR